MYAPGWGTQLFLYYFCCQRTQSLRRGPRGRKHTRSVSLLKCVSGCCCLCPGARAFSSCGERGLLFPALCGLLTAAVSLAAEHRPRGARASAAAARGRGCCVSRALEHGLSTCGPWTQLLPGTWESSRVRDRTRVPCPGRQVLIHCTTGKVLNVIFKTAFLPF